LALICPPFPYFITSIYLHFIEKVNKLRSLIRFIDNIRNLRSVGEFVGVSETSLIWEVNNSHPLEYTDILFLFVKASVNVVYAVNILQLFVKYQRVLSVCISVAKCGISSKYFATLCEIPTSVVHSYICW